MTHDTHFSVGRPRHFRHNTNSSVTAAVRSALLAIVLAAAPMTAEAQGTPKIARVGVLTGASLSTPGNARFREAFVGALRQFGWDEGKNLIVEARATDGRSERYAEFAAELVALNLDVVVGSGSQGAQALKSKTSTLPIVMLGVSHPVEIGLVASLARPGGNITGVTPQFNDVDAKARELLREVKPGLDRVGVLHSPSNAGSALSMKHSIESTPKHLGFSVVPVAVDAIADIDSAFAKIDGEHLRGLQVHPTPVITANAARFAALLIERRMATITGSDTLVREGLLMSYGPDQLGTWRDAAEYVDRVLRGTKPADLPVRQPSKFFLVINLRTANAIGLDIPPTLLARADEVIE